MTYTHIRIGRLCMLNYKCIVPYLIYYDYIWIGLFSNVAE